MVDNKHHFAPAHNLDPQRIPGELHRGQKNEYKKPARREVTAGVQRCCAWFD